MVLEEDFPMIEVSIPSLEREVDESGKSRKSGSLVSREETLCAQKKQRIPDSPQKTQEDHPDSRFPEQKEPHLRTKPVEQRRQELEDYIQDMIYQDEDVPQVLLDFLHVKHFHTGIKKSSMESVDDLDSQDYSYLLPNQPVLGFFQDPYLSDCTSDLPDIVVDGVLQGFYPRDVRVSFTAPIFTEPDPTTSIEA